MTTQNRSLGWIVLAGLLAALALLIKATAFSDLVVIIIYALMFSYGIWLTSPRRPFPFRLAWAVSLSITLVVAATGINAMVAPGEEGGAILGLMLFGIYLGLPTLLFSVLLGLLLKAEIAR